MRRKCCLERLGRKSLAPFIARFSRSSANALSHERVRKWIDEHPEDSRSIRELATLLGTHPRTLNRHFGCHIGKTVQEYRWERRAERAEQLLATSALKLEDVASAIGARSKATVYRL